MKDMSKSIFGNSISERDYRKALKSKKGYQKKFGDDTNAVYEMKLRKNPVIGDRLGVQDIRIRKAKNADAAGTHKSPAFADNAIIVGNIRMGFGHYRISMAMASCAKALGYTPYWLDLNSFPDTVATKVISAQNDLYSLGSRLSRFLLFNKFVWEPMNYEGFRALSYNASDQKNAELMVPIYRNIPKDIPVIGTHVWPSQAAVHAGMKHVVNAIPDNWPMALHLSEGALHTIQCRYAYQGYKVLNGFAKDQVLKPMPKDSLIYTGHYIDHELVSNIETDCDARLKRQKDGKPMRFLLTIGGAGAQKDIFAGIIKHLIPKIKEKKAALYVNVGDYKNVWEELVSEIPEMKSLSTEHFEDFKAASAFADQALEGDAEGIHGFYHSNIFEAVYITNLLMRSCDVLVTKPSELAFYPVPKLFIKRVGKHEMWGAIHSAEMGDGTLECRDLPHILQMTDLFMEDDSELKQMCQCIKENKKAGVYNGAYRAVELAMGLKKASES